MTGALRELQPLVLAVVLLGACAIKLSRVLQARSLRVVLDATGLFPSQWRRPASVALCVTELLLGVGLVVTTGRMGLGGWATGVRLATASLFLVATCALVEMRERRPGLGCGCFGDLSSKPPGVRSVARAGMLACAALASVGTPPPRIPSPGSGAAALDLAIVAAELLLLAAVSPEAGEALAKLGYAAPCDSRPFTSRRALSALHRSAAWRRHSGAVVSDMPTDMWRELCWWFAVYPARDRTGDYELVFAVEVKPHRPGVHAAMVGRATVGPRVPVVPVRKMLPAAREEPSSGVYAPSHERPSAIF